VDDQRTRLRVELAIEDEVDRDPVFAVRLRELVDQITGKEPDERRLRQVTVHATASGNAQMPVLGTGTQHNAFGGSEGR
jgi:hypothetical protein